jgi:hypothetical protein
MATNTYSILGQSTPVSSNADLLPVPGSTQAVVSTIAICNTTSSSATATVYVRKASGTTPAAAAAANALLFNAPIAGNTTQTLSLGITLGAYDTITVASGTANALTFHAFGSLVTA